MTATAKSSAAGRQSAPADPRLQQLQRNVALLGNMLRHVQENPDKSNVHKLRTSTRRSGAMLASLLAGRDIPAGQAKPVAKLQRQWKKIRRAAGMVRDLDVHRDLLEKLAGEWKTARGRAAMLRQEAQRLDGWLKQRRDREEKRLVAEAAKRAPAESELAHAVLHWILASPASRVPGDPAALATEDFARIAAEFLALDADNLHDFRKRTKEARYVAEAGGASAKPIERALKRIQDAIGDWHDHDALLLEAREALDRDSPLIALLENRRDEQCRSALVTTERIRARLLGEYYSSVAKAVRRGDVRGMASPPPHGQ